MEVRTKSKKGPKKKIGRPPKHGGYSIIYRDRAIKDHPEIRHYLEACREGLVKDVAGTEDKAMAELAIGGEKPGTDGGQD